MTKIEPVSVVIAAYNEEHYLGSQLGAVLAQLLPQDELILLDDGSFDGTRAIMDKFARRCLSGQAKILANPRPTGPNAAFNKASAEASREWVFTASANDILQPGAFEAFRRAAAAYPDAKVITGYLQPAMPVRWSTLPIEYLPPETVRQRWTSTIQIGGAAAFVRREFRGTLHLDLEWNADWLMLMGLILRHGLVAIDTCITRTGPPGYDGGQEDPVKWRPVRAAILRRIAADPVLAEAFASKPAVMRWLRTGEP